MELKISNISKKHGKDKILDNISINLKEGIYGLVGVNGAGKTTLLQIISNNLKADSGKIILENETIKRTYNIGYLPQSFKGFSSFSVLEFMKYIVLLRGSSVKNSYDDINEVLKLVNLENKKKCKIKKLSGGMLRRLGIAQAILKYPPIILLDEPTVGLDPIERESFKLLLEKISKKSIIILSTHILEDIENIASNILLLKDGKLTRLKTNKKIGNEIINKYR